MKKFFGKLLAVFFMIGFVAMDAMAAPANWYDGVTLDSTPVTTVAGVVVSALAAVWAIRKVIKLINRN